MNIFTDLGTGIGNVFEGIGNGISTAISPIGDVLQPIVQPIGNVMDSVGQGASGFIETGFDTGSRISSSIGDTAEGLGGFLSSPFSYLIIGVVAIIVLPKLL